MKSLLLVILVAFAFMELNISRASIILQPDLNPVQSLSGSSDSTANDWSPFLSSTQNLQPGINAVPMLPSNFSMKPGDWPHSTPLLQKPDISPSDHLRKRKSTFWRGWRDVSYIFAFGDSYISTNFTIDGEQPRPSNPLGNPVYPGATSAAGPNFIDFITTTYNQSYIQTYDLGYGGAVVDDAVVKNNFGFSVQSFVNQVEKLFLPTYVSNDDVPWTPLNSLFIVLVGINDVLNSYALGNDSINYEVIQSYQKTINKLYAAGARNFLFMNIPPVDRSPKGFDHSKADQSIEAAYIGAFNFRLGALVYNLGLRHPDTTSFVFDTNFLFTRALNDPAQFEETRAYKNVTNYCRAYALWAASGHTEGPSLGATVVSSDGTSALTYFDSACGVPVNEYFWLNDLHPTYPMHNFIGSQIVKLLSAAT